MKFEVTAYYCVFFAEPVVIDADSPEQARVIWQTTYGRHQPIIPQDGAELEELEVEELSCQSIP